MLYSDRIDVSEGIEHLISINIIELIKQVHQKSAIFVIIDAF